MARILIIDIETAPNVAYVWRFFKENVGAKQVLENGYILSYAAKWLNEPEVFYDDVRDKKEDGLLTGLAKLLDAADIVVAHNGDRFDLPHISGRFLVHGISIPSPYKSVDTCLVARKEFAFPSNSLEYLSNVLDLPVKKGGHKKFPGFELWLGVLKNNEEAWEEMREYNIDDIYTLEHLYLRLRPFIRNHPNVAVYEEHDEVHCPKCNSDHLQWRGSAYTNVGKYKRFQCQDCGGWGRTRTTEMPIKQRKVIVTNQVN